MNYILELLEASRACTNPEWSKQLMDCADTLAIHLQKLHKNPTAEHLQQVNSQWSRGFRLIECAKSTHPPAGTKGKIQVDAAG